MVRLLKRLGRSIIYNVKDILQLCKNWIKRNVWTAIVIVLVAGFMGGCGLRTYQHNKWRDGFCGYLLDRPEVSRKIFLELQNRCAYTIAKREYMIKVR